MKGLRREVLIEHLRVSYLLVHHDHSVLILLILIPIILDLLVKLLCFIVNFSNSYICLNANA
jgi:hypothetical protein